MKRTREQWQISAIADEALQKFASLLQSAGKKMKKDPESGAFAASVAIHALMLLALSYFSLVPFGTPFGNGIEPGDEGAGVSVNYTPPQAQAKMESKSQAAVLKAAVTPKSSSGTMVLAKSRPVKKPDEKLPKKLAQLKPSETQSPVDIKAQKALSDNDISEKIFPKHEKKSTAALDIPAEVGKEIGKKLRSADYSDQESASTAEVTAKSISAPEGGGILTLQKTGVKMIDEEGELIASAAQIGEMAQKPSNSEGGDESLSGSGQSASDAKTASGVKGAGKKGGTGAFGSPNGSKKSGIAFEMVENSTYNETPSFLNGPPDISYPKWAQEQGAEGTVMVILEILPNGEVGSVTKHQSPISDRLAQDLVRQAEMWRFKPIYKNGKALSGSVMVAVDYSLKNK